jgi:hypothetical protein
VTKPGLPTKTRVPGHKPSSLPRVDRNRARVFPGAVADTGPGTRARSSLSFLSVAQEGKGLAHCVAFAPHSVQRSQVPTSLNGWWLDTDFFSWCTYPKPSIPSNMVSLFDILPTCTYVFPKNIYILPKLLILHAYGLKGQLATHT